jgi:chromate transporter
MPSPPASDAVDPPGAAAPGRAAEVFQAFLKLGLTSFGGPIAHIGYFHRELITRRRWVSEAHFAQLVALCQALPGPASSQLGFALGLIRAGWLGALAAFVAFTLPSALLMFAFAWYLPALDDGAGMFVMQGLKLAALAVVAQGVRSMALQLTPDVPRVLIAVAAGALVLITGASWMQLAAIAAGALLGMVFYRHLPPVSDVSFSVRYGVQAAAILIAAFALLLVASLAIDRNSPSLASVGAAFYRAGALVFGGGHVVLPLLQQEIVSPGWVSQDEFLAGYGGAQAVPGPLFSIAAFLGGRIDGYHGAIVALLAIFLPGLLLVAGALPLWKGLATRGGPVGALAGINAAVVGLLAAALYDPLWKSAIFTPSDFIIALAAFLVLASTRTSVLLVIAGCVLAAFAASFVDATP